MSARPKNGFTGGALGALILIAVMYLLQITGLTGAPGFVGNYRAVFAESPPYDHVIAAVLFALSGGIWGLIYGAAIRRPTVLNAMLFSLLPTLWLWLVVAPVTGKPLFNGFALQGILLPLIFNVVIWGSFLGWYCRMKRNPLD